MRQKLRAPTGLFGGAGVIALFGVGALVACAILALDLALSVWLAALIVGVALLVGAGIAALLGKKQVSKALPAKPAETIDNVKADLASVKEHNPNG